MAFQDVFIVSAVRTPIGTLNGNLSPLKGHDLGAMVIRESLARAVIEGSDVSEVIMGQVLTASQGQNPVRQASIAAGLPNSIPAWGVNMLCGSGLKAIALGAQAIQVGDANIIVAGGQESMSQAPHTLALRTNESKFGNVPLVDTLLQDGLMDAFENCHMGITAENVAKDYSVSREEQDAFSVKSQEKYASAKAAGYFDKEITPVMVKTKKETIEVRDDEHPRPNTSVDKLAKLRSAFIPNGTVTAGNASGINDGAAAVVLLSKAEMEKRNVHPIAKIIAWAQTAIEPRIMGMGPVSAVKKALQKAGWSVQDIDLFELNEAFAAQSVAVSKELGISIDKINVQGGAIALGHPIGASGARILVTLLYALQRTKLKKGVAALCIGGGMGIAMCVELV